MIWHRGIKFVNEAHWAAYSRGYQAKMSGGKKDENPFDPNQTPYYFDQWLYGFVSAGAFLKGV
jgi:ribosome modulation factor